MLNAPGSGGADGTGASASVPPEIDESVDLAGHNVLLHDHRADIANGYRNLLPM
jgi:hypothetical protein